MGCPGIEGLAGQRQSVNEDRTGVSLPAQIGRYAEARKLFEHLLACCNDVGLLAEEFDPVAGRMLGNFPQAYSHVGLINCALGLSRQTGPAEERAEST
jgi:hypothetical protein